MGIVGKIAPFLYGGSKTNTLDSPIVYILFSFLFQFRFSTECFDQGLAPYCSSTLCFNFHDWWFPFLDAHLLFFYCPSCHCLQHGPTLLPTFTTHARFHIDHVSFVSDIPLRVPVCLQPSYSEPYRYHIKSRSFKIPNQNSQEEESD